ncbi:unnamed protein product, partial [marine sediment metagenome]
TFPDVRAVFLLLDPSLALNSSRILVRAEALFP